MATTHAFTDLVHDMRDEMHDLTHITSVKADRQAYLGLWATFVLVPLLFGLDKVFSFTNTNWEGYVANWVNNIVPGTASDAVTYFGVIEVAVAALVLFVPRLGGDIFAAWMVLAALSVLAIGGMPVIGYGAVALAVCALAMARLSTTYHPRS